MQTPQVAFPNPQPTSAEEGQGAGGSSETGYAAKHTPSAASEATLNTDKLEEVRKLFTAHLENKGLRKTGERYAILEEIYARSGHFDVDELYAGMKERGLQVSRATVYNTLDLLVEQGLVSKHQFGRNLAQYEKSYGYRQHDHVICTECHKVVEFCDPRIHGIQTMVGDLLNFHILHHSLNLYGICGDCRAQAAARSSASST
ncbi:Fur family transcriptional regulator [Hymenobacter ruricola]|uniref:Ferric uptake regulation protein n=1 Tax=Hymenobacter ruricola TaxID=2791023 RepID=A0ABS0I0F4_9BACT|nr:transcriptional repressor [Hymenobacter ruricola]MBF9220266.1 transcriptional repressor [Hymenobacter ruricola]